MIGLGSNKNWGFWGYLGPNFPNRKYSILMSSEHLAKSIRLASSGRQLDLCSLSKAQAKVRAPAWVEENPKKKGKGEGSFATLPKPRIWYCHLSKCLFRVLPASWVARFQRRGWKPKITRSNASTGWFLGEIGDVPEKKMEIFFLKNQLTNSIIVSFH